ncbi:MAG: hypothetical protein ACE5JL_13255 [Dehalococcoidia bacterium]
MSKERDRELEKPESWNFEQAEVREPVKASRVVLSVAFRRDDFARVSEYAERTGKKPSEFVREAAIEKATGQGASFPFYGTGSAGVLWLSDSILSYTKAFATLVGDPQETPASTY